jgi:hypothetical protein
MQETFVALQAFQAYLKALNRSPATVAGYVAHTRLFLAWLCVAPAAMALRTGNRRAIREVCAALDFAIDASFTPVGSTLAADRT